MRGELHRFGGRVLDRVARWADETRGRDFALELAPGAIVGVMVEGARVLDESPSGRLLGYTSAADARGPYSIAVLREVTVGPGDLVELCGCLDRRPSPLGEGLERSARLLDVVRADARCPLVVRILESGNAPRP